MQKSSTFCTVNSKNIQTLVIEMAFMEIVCFLNLARFEEQRLVYLLGLTIGFQMKPRTKP